MPASLMGADREPSRTWLSAAATIRMPASLPPGRGCCHAHLTPIRPDSVSGRSPAFTGLPGANPQHPRAFTTRRAPGRIEPISAVLGFPSRRSRVRDPSSACRTSPLLSGSRRKRRVSAQQFDSRRTCEDRRGGARAAELEVASRSHRPEQWMDCGQSLSRTRWPAAGRRSGPVRWASSAAGKIATNGRGGQRDWKQGATAREGGSPGDVAIAG